MNTQSILQRGLERNLRLLHIERRPPTLLPSDRPIVAQMLREHYAAQGLDPLTFERKVQDDLQKLFGGG